MKITCDIVRDLMPLYVDDVCSDDSRKLIEDHINHCSKCQNELAAMKEPIECPPLSDRKVYRGAHVWEQSVGAIIHHFAV